MMVAGVCFLLLLVEMLSFFNGEAGDHAVSYANKGKDWKGTCQNGTQQSPIALDFASCTNITEKALKFVNYRSSTFIYKLTPTTIDLKPRKSGKKVGIRDGGLKGFYKLIGAHFHWPAEHLIDKKRYSLEVHLVHLKEHYRNMKTAREDPFGIAVVGVLYRKGKKDSGIAELQKMVNQSKVRNLKPSDLLPEEKSTFFRYNGSLTTPNCAESVVWTVFNEHRTISENQINWFKTLELHNGSVVENYREEQKIGQRKVYFQKRQPENSLSFLLEDYFDYSENYTLDGFEEYIDYFIY